MKKCFPFLALVTALGVSQLTLAQKTEVSVSLDSGLFSFAGPLAVRTSSINTDGYLSAPLIGSTTGYTNSIAGKLPGFSYGLSGQIQRVSRSNFIVGAGFGFENLKSKVLIDRINPFGELGSFAEAATGKSILSNQFLNVSPYLGYRIKMNEIALDLTAGLDVGYLINSMEKGEAENGKELFVTTSRERDWGINFDIRPQIQATVSYQRFGVYAGYAHGLSNYYREYDGGNPRAYSRLVRFGVTYKIKS